MNAFAKLSAATAIALGLLFVPGQPALAQTPADTLRPATITTDSTLVLDIAPYRDDVRRAALLVSQQTPILTNLAQQQARSQQAFDSLMLSYGKNKQDWFYDIARFPGVLHELATLPARADKSAGRALTKTLPPASQESAWRLYRHHHDDLTLADRINQQADQIFDRLIAPLDQPTQAAFRQLLVTPDVLTLLNRDIDQTTRLGRAYQADSAGITRQLVVLHDSLEAQNQRELADYQRELSGDPLAQQELQLAGQAYARSNRYNTTPMPNPADSLYYDQNPYSFWSGYPVWYSSPVWYPSSWWYSTGFYVRPGGNLVLSRLPSPGFCNWFFSRPYRAYPNLCNRFNSYYNRHVGAHRFWGHNASGFMAIAHRTFGPRTDASFGGNNWLTNPRRYSRSNSWSGSGTSVWSTAPAHRSYSAGTRSYHPSVRSSSSSHTRSFSSGHHSSPAHHSSSFHSSGGHSGGSHHSSGHR